MKPGEFIKQIFGSRNPYVIYDVSCIEIGRGDNSYNVYFAQHVGARPHQYGLAHLSTEACLDYRDYAFSMPLDQLSEKRFERMDLIDISLSTDQFSLTFLAKGIAHYHKKYFMQEDKDESKRREIRLTHKNCNVALDDNYGAGIDEVFINPYDKKKNFHMRALNSVEVSFLEKQINQEIIKIRDSL